MKRIIYVVWMLLATSAGLSAQTTVSNPVSFTWNANAPSDNVTGYRFILDSTITDVGNVVIFTAPTLTPGPHTASVLAYSGAAVSPPSAPLTFTIAGQTDPCIGLSVVVTSYTTPLKGGVEGQVVAKVLAPAPVLQIQVKLDAQVIGEINGTELRFVRAIGFGTPRIPGTYNLFVTAADNRGCHTSTTAARPLVIQ